MVVLVGTGNPKAQRNTFEEDARRRFALRAKIITGMKEQLVFALGEGIALQQRRIAAPIGIGHGLGEAGAGLAVEAIEFESDAMARASASGVEHMGCQIPHETSCGLSGRVSPLIIVYSYCIAYLPPPRKGVAMADRSSAPLPLQLRPSRLDRAAFIARFGDLYESSPWIAEAAWDLGLGPEADSLDGLATRLAAVLDAADEDRQLGVIRAHPDLAGKAALAGALTDDSLKEQAGAGLDQCTPEELARFTRLNEAYQARFAFPFVIAVKGKDRHAILAAFEDRLDNSPEEERRTAIDQIHRIARLRLESRVAEYAQ